MNTPRKAVLLDRDGVIVRDTGYIRSPRELEIIERVPEALILLREAGYLLIVVSNQSGVARGLMTLADCIAIGRELERMLLMRGARLDAQYFCPHHPAEGTGEFRCECFCRKPAPGMLKRAMREWNIDASMSWMIGDNTRDIEAGLNAGVTPLYIGGPPRGVNTHNDLMDAAKFILENPKG